jgi:transposase
VAEYVLDIGIRSTQGGILMRRHELTDDQFRLLEPYLPRSGSEGGHPWAEHRRILNGLFWKLRTGAQWRDIPERYGPWSTIYDRYRRWCQEGRFACMLVALRQSLDERGSLDWEQWWVDSTSIRASRAATGARKKGGLQTSQQTTP